MSSQPVQLRTTPMPVDTRDNKIILNFRDLVNITLGFVGLCTALIFGVWAIRSYNAAVLANQYASASLQAADDPSMLDATNVNSKLLLLLLCEERLRAQDSGLDCDFVDSKFSIGDIAQSLAGVTTHYITTVVSTPPSTTENTRTSTSLNGTLFTSSSASGGATSDAFQTTQSTLTTVKTRTSTPTPTSTYGPPETSSGANSPGGLGLGTEIGIVVGVVSIIVFVVLYVCSVAGSTTGRFCCCAR